MREIIKRVADRYAGSSLKDTIKDNFIFDVRIDSIQNAWEFGAVISGSVRVRAKTLGLDYTTKFSSLDVKSYGKGSWGLEFGYTKDKLTNAALEHYLGEPFGEFDEAVKAVASD